MLEVRSIDSISMNLDKRVEGFYERITIIESGRGFLIVAELIRVQSRISLVLRLGAQPRRALVNKIKKLSFLDPGMRIKK